MNLLETSNLANSLMAKHNLISQGWVFEFDNAKRRFGVCRFRSKVIGLSKPLVSTNDVTEVTDTILHEIAHALVGCGHGHDYVWKAKCREIGCRPERCYTPQEGTRIEGRYQATCGGCKTVFHRYKVKKSTAKSACKCQSHLSWDRKSLLVYVDTKYSLQLAS
jgi:predicted SprT family Zn-dependent metalloprotease